MRISDWSSDVCSSDLLVCALLAASIWVLIDWGLLQADSGDAIAWIVLVCAAIILAVGLSWAHVWRRLTGQYAVDEIERSAERRVGKEGVSRGRYRGSPDQ